MYAMESTEEQEYISFQRRDSMFGTIITEI